MSTPRFRKKLDFYRKTEYNKNAKSVKKRRTVSSLKKGGDAMGTYVTYESLFALMQILLTLIGVITGIITLVIAIVKLYAEHSDSKNKRKK